MLPELKIVYKCPACEKYYIDNGCPFCHHVIDDNTPGFKEIFGTSPSPGVDYDPDKSISQDDYEYYTSTGRYIRPGWMAGVVKEEELDDYFIDVNDGMLMRLCGVYSVERFDDRFNVFARVTYRTISDSVWQEGLMLFTLRPLTKDERELL